MGVVAAQGAQEVLQREAWVPAGAAWMSGPGDTLAKELSTAEGLLAELQR